MVVVWVCVCVWIPWRPLALVRAHAPIPQCDWSQTVLTGNPSPPSCVCVCVWMEGCVWMTAKLNARANKATGSHWQRRGQDQGRKTCRHWREARGWQAERQLLVAVCVSLCLCAIDWLSFNVAPCWGVTDIKGSINKGKWGGARTTSSYRGIKQVMSSALSTNTPDLSIFYFSYIACCLFTTSVSTTKNVGTTKTHFLCGPWWRLLCFCAKSAICHFVY